MSLYDIKLPDFVPHPLIRSAHLMTISGARLRAESKLLLATSIDRIVTIDDTTKIRVRISRLDHDKPKPTLVLVHGLVGDDRSPYMIGCAENALNAGFDVARVNLRNCGGTEELTTSCYHGGITADVAGACSDLVENDGVQGIVVAGFSLGGGIVLRWAGELGTNAPDWLRAVGAVSPAVDFAVAAAACEKSRTSRFYQRRFVSDLKQLLARKHGLFPKLFPDPTDVPIKTLREFDDRYTSRLSGFDGVDDYYAKASARPLLGSIACPTLIITAEDDPLVPIEMFAEVNGKQNPWIRFVATQHGGHCGFVGANPALAPQGVDSSRRWVEHRVVQLAQHVLDAAW